MYAVVIVIVTVCLYSSMEEQPLAEYLELKPINQVSTYNSHDGYALM